MNEFQNKIILITGASRGIGLALAKTLDKSGAQLLLHASSSEGLCILKSYFLDKRHSYWQCNFTEPEHIEKGLIEMLDVIGPLDGFVNCVGMRIRRPLNLLNIRIIQEAFHVNFTSYMEMIRLVSKRNKYNKGMSIISISSISAHSGAPGVSIYAATKGAVESATRCLAQELHKKGIRINTIVSGQVNTEAYADLMENRVGVDDPVLKRQYMGLIDAESVVDACLFLLSGKSKFLTSTSFPLDGGFLT